MAIFSHPGDAGYTDISGDKIRKNNILIQFLGSIDESASAINIARVHIKDKNKDLNDELIRMVKTLSHIASVASGFKELDTDKEVLFLEERIEYYKSKVIEIKLFTYPETLIASFFDNARVTVRRTERFACINNFQLAFLNRLSDYLFFVTQYVEKMEKEHEY